MSNRDRAAEVIWDAQASGLAKPRDLADELDDAGLLAPDLPDHIEISPDNMPDMYTNGGHVYAVLNNGYDSDWERLDPSEATDFALRLLAAAAHAQKDNNHE